MYPKIFELQHAKAKWYYYNLHGTNIYIYIYMYLNNITGTLHMCKKPCPNRYTQTNFPLYQKNKTLAASIFEIKLFLPILSHLIFILPMFKTHHEC